MTAPWRGSALLDDGHLLHVECGLRYVTACGEVLDPAETGRLEYDPDEHEVFCFDCV